VDHLLSVAGASGTRAQVFTLHAELEGGKYLRSFERLLREWQQRGAQLTDLASYAATLDASSLPRCRILAGTVPGRSGTLATQGPALH